MTATHVTESTAIEATLLDQKRTGPLGLETARNRFRRTSILNKKREHVERGRIAGESGLGRLFD